MSRFIVCEQYPAYVQHIRLLPDGEATEPGGYTRPRMAMCGVSVRTGWDIPISPLPTNATQWKSLIGAYWACKRCGELYLASR